MRTGSVESHGGGARCPHAVQIYGSEGELAGPVASYLAEGFDADEPALVVATPRHVRDLTGELERRGWSEPALDEAGLLTTAHAESTLASFLEGGGPSPARFHLVIGGLLAAIEGRRRGRPVRIFGEMVDLLARRGRHGAALAVEELWDDLARRHGFSLLCAYRLDVFDPAAQRDVLPGVCRAHANVGPAADPARLEEAVDAALEAALGPDEAERVRGLAGGSSRDEHIPAAQLALMWVSARMPAAAGRILAAARSAYEAPGATLPAAVR